MRVSNKNLTANLKFGLVFFVLVVIARFDVFSHEAAMVFAYLVAFGISAVYFVSNRSTVVASIKAWPNSIFYTSVVFYFSKVVAEKSINSTMGIESEFIRQSSIVGGFFISIPLSLMLVSMYLIVRIAFAGLYANALVINFFCKRPDERFFQGETSGQEKYPSLKPMFAMCVLFFAALLLSQFESGIRYAVMLDAMKYSDCGPPEVGFGYVRKNINSCYKFDTHILKGGRAPIEVPSKKPS